MIQWMDNFGSYGIGLAVENGMLDGLPYAQFSGSGSGRPRTAVNPDGISSDTVLFCGTATRLAVPTPEDQIGIAARIWLPNIPDSNNTRCALFDYRTPANDYRYKVIVEPNGALSVYYSTVQDPGTPSAALATTVVPAIFPQSWVHFEFTVDFVTGEFELRREGSMILSGTHNSPPGETCGNILLNAAGASNTGNTAFYCKDLILWDTTGSQNNDFVGPCAVYRLAVNEDISSGWTPSSGSSDYELLDESPPNDSDYITAEDSPLPSPSIMGFQNLPDYIVGVRALMSLVRAWKTDGGDANLQVSLISEGDLDTGGDRNISTTPTYWWDISELSPDTGQAWNPIEVNNAEVQINRTA